MLSIIPNWQIIKTIGGSRIVAIAGLFPFVGYLVVANTSFAEFIVLITDRFSGETNFELVYNRLKDIYLGMLSLSAGVILYKLFCPPSISKFQDRYEFLEKEISIATPLRVESIRHEMNSLWFWEPPFFSAQLKSEISDTKGEKLDNTKIADLSHPSHVDGRGMKSLKAYQSDEGIPLAQLYSAYFDMQDARQGPIRLLALAAFVYGYVTMAWPSVSVANQIIRAL